MIICSGIILIDENEFHVPLLIVASHWTKIFLSIYCIHCYIFGIANCICFWHMPLFPRMKGQNKSKFLEHGCSQHTVDMGVNVGLSLHHWFRWKVKRKESNQLMLVFWKCSIAAINTEIHNGIAILFNFRKSLFWYSVWL